MVEIEIEIEIAFYNFQSQPFITIALDAIPIVPNLNPDIRERRWRGGTVGSSVSQF